jgi:antitoxin MazE
VKAHLPLLPRRCIFIVYTLDKGEQLRTNLQKWGNSLAVRIPRAYAKEANMTSGTLVEMTLEKGKLVIVPVAEPEYFLEALISGVTKKNLHREIGWDSPLGQEVW